jgi:RNA polymerase sigma-70 factor (ECF subfamily)
MVAARRTAADPGWVGYIIRTSWKIAAIGGVFSVNASQTSPRMSGPFEEGTIDAELLGRLLDRHGPALALYAAQWAESPEDCVQEAFVELARQRTVPGHVVGWLYRVVKNRALNAARKARRRREREAKSVAGRIVIDRHPATFDRGDAAAVVEALDHMTDGDRELIVMRIWGGLTFEEIAAAQSVAVSSAHRQYGRALEKLRHLLEATCSTEKNRKTMN